MTRRNDRTKIRTLRSKLKSLLDSGETHVIGGPYEIRAFVVSVPKHDHWSKAERRKAIAQAKRSFKECIASQDY